MTVNYPIPEGCYQSGKWTWFFSVCSAFGDIGLVETEIALRAFRHHMRDQDVKLHVLYASPENEKLRVVIKSAEPDLYLEQSHNYGKMGNLDILVQTVRTQYAAVAHCDTFVVADDLLKWPHAVFDSHLSVHFIYPPGMVGGFSHGWYELNLCHSYLCCFRTEIWRDSGIPFGEVRHTIHPGKKLAPFKGVGGYVETPRVNTEVVGRAFFRLIQRFGVRAVMLWPEGFVQERITTKPSEFLKKAKAVHLALTYWSQQKLRTGKESLNHKAEYDFIIKRRKVVLELLEKYRELTPDISVVDYEVSDSVGVMR